MTTQDLVSMWRILKKENFVSIRDLQKSPTKSLTSVYWPKVIINNWKPMWVYLDYDDYEELMEDLEALSSKNYLKKIEESRKSELVSAEKVWEELGI